jgi:hypothetical protein
LGPRPAAAGGSWCRRVLGCREVHFWSERPCEGAVPSAKPEWLSSESLPGTVLDVLPRQRGELRVKPAARARQLSESNLRGLREASPVGHVPRRGDSGSTGRAYWPDRLRPGVSPMGSGSPFRPGPGARGSEGCSQRSAALGIRLPGGATRATKSSQLFLPLRLSQDGTGADPEDGLRVGLDRGAQSCRASVEGQPAGRRGSAPKTFSVDRAAGAAGPTISSRLKERPRLSSHKFQSHGNAQAHRRGYSIPSCAGPSPPRFLGH